MYAGHIVGLLFLAAQVASIGYARFVPERFFCWAPYDQHTLYQVRVVLDDRELTTREVQIRYQYRAEAWEPRSIDNVFSIIRQFESTYGRNDNAEVTVIYSTNGHAEATWNWPQP